MRVTIYSESSSDETAVRVFVEKICGAPITLTDPPRLAARGWPSVRNLLPSVLKHAYWHQAADAVVVVVDSDETSVHTRAHEQRGKAAVDCRVCVLQGRIAETQRHLAERPGSVPLVSAVGLAVPAIEAWLLTGRHQYASEASWAQARQRNAYNHIKRELKTAAAALRQPDESPEDTAGRLASEAAHDLSRVETAFPGGFGALARAVRSWPPPPG